MCGISGIFGTTPVATRLEAMVDSQHHRGPDDTGTYIDTSGRAGLGHNRLSIIDLSSAGRQPMCSADGRLQMVFNGEIYNYRELRAELGGASYRSNTDSEVVLAAYERWGPAALDRMVGMFAFLIWDTHAQRLFAARDRFGVKPLFYHVDRDSTLFVASEVQALHAAGVPAEPDPVAWATYFVSGVHDHTDRTFWDGIKSLPAGHMLEWRAGRLRISRWYDLAERAGDSWDSRPAADVEDELRTVLTESVRLRFRADVPVGICLSGGLDSSLLLGLVNAVHGRECQLQAFTFLTGDACYDELPWVRQMLATTQHSLVPCLLRPQEVPELAESVQRNQAGPFGGIPTLAYARLFEHARAAGVTVLLDGQGVDEQWAGYDYYRTAHARAAVVQGTSTSPVRPHCLSKEFRVLAEPVELRTPFPDPTRNLQYRDTVCTKIPRALRFNDAASMRSSTELREPFLDHRLFELAFRQPLDRKIVGDTGKWLARRVASALLPAGIVEAPKRPVQTPQREWLRGPLRAWAEEEIDNALRGPGRGWFDADAVRDEWDRYCDGQGDNSYFVWQWINLGLIQPAMSNAHAPVLQ